MNSSAILKSTQTSEIVEAIQQLITTTDFTIWTVGVTDNPERRRLQHEKEGEDVKYWKDWNAGTEAIAKTVEKHFLAKGMSADTGGDDHPTYVYVF